MPELGQSGPKRDGRAKSGLPLRSTRLWLAGERAKSLRRPAVLRACFVSRRDLEQERLIERPPEKFHGDRNLIGLGAFEPAAVRIVDIRYAVINHPGESRWHHDCRKT